MIQKTIRPWLGVPYTNAGADELTQELNDRTVYGVDGYNSIAELGAKTAAIETKTDNITVTQAVDLDQLETDTATNTAKRSYPIADENRLANTSGTNTGDQDISGIATNATGITTLQGEQTTQDAAIALNTAKTGITAQQASDITTNNAKVSYTDGAIVAKAIVSDTTVAGGGTAVGNMVEITQAAYDALTPDANTWYLING